MRVDHDDFTRAVPRVSNSHALGRNRRGPMIRRLPPPVGTAAHTNRGNDTCCVTQLRTGTAVGVTMLTAVPTGEASAGSLTSPRFRGQARGITERAPHGAKSFVSSTHLKPTLYADDIGQNPSGVCDDASREAYVHQ